MECLTEFDELQEALKKVPMDEDVMPYYMGRLVENEGEYNKIQKLLACPEMQNSHKYLYDLDIENLDEDDCEKIDKLFDLGVKKGYIDNSFQEELDKEENPTAIVADEQPDMVPVKPVYKSVSVPCWTVLYSATKNGETKCGECYSNAISTAAAKADCLAKLNRFGYENVQILAMEAGDPDCAGKCDCCDENEVEENDILRNRPHNAHVSELNEEDADAEINEDDDTEIDETSGNPYAAGMKIVTGGKTTASKKTPAKKVDEEDEASEDDSDSTETDDSESDSDNDEADSDDSEIDSDDDETNSADDADDDSEDDNTDDSEDDSENDSEDDNTDDSEDDSEDDSDSSDSEETDDEDKDESDDDKELTDEEKAQLKDDYRRIFKETMLKCKFTDKCFNDLSIEQKVKFLEAIQEKWTKSDPKNFMSTKEQDQLEAVVVTE